MIIAVNALSAVSGGGITYFTNILPALDRISSEDQYVILIPRRCHFSPGSLSARIQLKRVTIPFSSPAYRVLYEQLALPFYLARSRADLLYSPTDISPFRTPCPVVLAMRNPTLFTDYKLPWKGAARARLAILRWLSRISARKAARIIFVSEASRRLVSRKLRLNPGKTVAVHHGINPDFGLPAGNAYGDKLPPLPARYLLAVSTIYSYKNFLNLIKAYQLLISRHDKNIIPLVIVGGNQDPGYFRLMAELIRKEDLHSRVILTGNLAYALAPYIYSRAEIFIFPSYLETFGHPSLEAMISGVPVAAARTGVMKEILGDAALYFDPFSEEEMAEKIKILMDDAELRKRLIEKGKRRVKGFSWEVTARKTLAVFRQAYDNRHVTE
ncbi:MAG: glycosyltransferase family 1 protein [PVC group bacterium]